MTENGEWFSTNKIMSVTSRLRKDESSSSMPKTNVRTINSKYNAEFTNNVSAARVLVVSTVVVLHFDLYIKRPCPVPLVCVCINDCGNQAQNTWSHSINQEILYGRTHVLQVVSQEQNKLGYSRNNHPF